LAVNGAAELGEEHYERVFQEAALFHVLKKCGRGLVDIVTLVRQLPFDRDVLVPTAVEKLYEADATLD
jgi:hypothetical protein